MSVSSNQRNILRRLIKNKPALCGMMIIILSILTAVFGYFISPDGTPDANRMIIEIGGRKPGFVQQFLKIPIDAPNADPSFIERLIYGKRDRFQYIPISGYEQKKDRRQKIRRQYEGYEDGR